MAFDVTELVYIDSTGYNFSDYPTFLSALQSAYQSIYGADVYLGADSQDGQFLAVLAQAFYDTAALGAAVYNSFSPVTAQGVGLSRLVKINGLEREIPSFSTVTLTIVGVAGTVITNGQAQDILNQIWVLPTTVTIPGGGSIDVTATAQVVGDVTADADTITTIFTPTLGWQTVNNSSPATPGAAVESDATLVLRQSVSTAIPAQTVFDATLGALANVAGVTAVRGYENYTNTTGGGGSGSDLQTPHSISIVVAGGSSVAICQTIVDYKTPGTDTYGDTTELVYDAKGLPYYINYQEAVTAEIGVQVTLTEGAAWTSDYETQIATAIATFINAQEIGSVILYTSLFLPAYLNGQAPANAYIITGIQIKKNSGSFAASNITLVWDEQPVCNPSVDVVFVT